MSTPEQATRKVPSHQLAEVEKRRKTISQKFSKAVSLQRGFQKKPFSLIAPSQLHHLPANMAAYYKTRVLRNPFYLFLSVARRTLGLHQPLLLTPLFIISQNTNKNPVLPHTSSTLDVNPQGGGFRSRRPCQSSPLLPYALEEQTLNPLCSVPGVTVPTTRMSVFTSP